MVTAILDHRDDLQLVGARVYSDDKNGVDIGTLVGRDPIGVSATTDVDAILALDADCVLYTPRTARVDDVCALLASGKNVATTAFMFHPQRMRAADRDRVLAACEAGASSVHGSGLNPGNLSGVLPLALSGHEPHHREDHPAGAGRLVGVREHRDHVRQHGLRSAGRR